MKCQRDKFSLQRKISYLNGAYMSPLLKKVEKAGIKGLIQKRKPFHISPAAFFKETEVLRNLFGQLINSSESARHVIIPSVSYGIENVVQNLEKKKGNIVMAAGQFPSNVYPWSSRANYQLKFVAAPTGGKNLGVSWNERILAAIDDQTAAVSIGQVHWVNGIKFDLTAIRQKTRAVGAALIIDGTQSVGALPFDVQAVQPDALVVAGYKWLMGPYSIGMAYYGEMFDQGTPIENNWMNRQGSDQFSGLTHYEEQFLPGALRYEVGEHSNFILVPMLIAAIKQLLKWTPLGIQQYCETLCHDTIETLRSEGYTIEATEGRASHLFGIYFNENTTMERIEQALSKHRVNISVREKALRISPNVYNDQKDVQRLLSALKEAII
ncbi:aminotransferase class V-fold PLP-dependent enzyme [Cyclobacteriaceae bacterium]|jgi:selenocysteine lyase/cysteine desulfurase|nr:aminotransferase class V-fold PLP-dependent enzyme [Cyclobacteriaceae bacterium]|tara:strand:+ start:9507 stop:10649 length:1143 start_codon:yes stop_codon:yes gene_type:complete